MTGLLELVSSVDRYVLRGVPTGSFLEAVISNDLREAMARADEGSRACLFELVTYLHNDCPGGCWGSPERYRDWMAMDPDGRLRFLALTEFGVRHSVVAPDETEAPE